MTANSTVRNVSAPTPPVTIDPTAPSSTAVRSMLMEEAVAADALAIGTAKKNQVALFANPFRNGQEEALIIDAGGRLTYLQRSETSETGWTQEAVPVIQSSVTEVAALIHPMSQEVWAACVDAGSRTLLMLRLESGSTWTTQTAQIRNLEGAWSQLFVFYSSARPAVAMLFGLDLNSTVVRVLKPNPNGVQPWDGFNTQALAATPEEFVAGYTFNNPDRGPWVVLGRSGSTITYWCFDQSSLNLVKTTVVAEDALALSGVWDTPQFGIGVAYLDTNRDFVLGSRLQGFFGFQTRSLKGLGYRTATVWQDPNGRLQVYGITDSNVLQVIRQTDWQYSNIGPFWPIWAQTTATDGSQTLTVVSLDGNVATFLLDPFPSTQPTQLLKIDGASPSEAFRFYTHDVTTASWLDEKIRLPSKGDPHIVTRYVCEARLLNFYQTPLAGYEVSVSASSLVEVLADEVSYVVSPSRSVSLRTDTFGKISFSIDADGLTPPVLYVNAVGLEQGAVIRPAADVHAYLAGEGTLSRQQQLLDDQTLKDAKVDGQPLVTNWVISAGQAVSSFKDAFGAAAGKSPPTRRVAGWEEPQTIHGFVIQTADPSRPGYQEFVSEIDFQRSLTLHHSDPRFGGTWDDITRWAADVWEGIQEGVIKVQAVAVDLKNRVATLSIYIGSKIIDLRNLILATFDDAAHVVEAIFQQVGAVASRVLEWLKALFNFKDIWDTKTAFHNLLKQAPRIFTMVSQHFGTIAEGWFQAQEQKVREAFSALRAKYGNGRIAIEMQEAQTGIPMKSGEHLRGRDMLDHPQANWLLNRVTANADAVKGLSRSLSDGTNDLWNQLLQAWQSSGAAQEISTAVNAFSEIFKTLIDFNNPEPIGQPGLDRLFLFIESIIQALLKTCDALVHFFLAIVQSGMDNLDATLSTPIELGPVNRLYQWIQKSLPNPPSPLEELTLGGLISLLAAFPVTVFYKLIEGVDAAPFPGGKLPSKPLAQSASEESGWGGKVIATVLFFLQAVFAFIDIGADIEGLSEKYAKSTIFNWWAIGWTFLILLFSMPVFQVDANGNITPTFGNGYDVGSQWLNWFWSAWIAGINVYTAMYEESLLRSAGWTGEVNKGALLTSFLGFGNYLSYAIEYYFNLNQPVAYAIGNGVLLASNALQFLRIGPPGPLHVVKASADGVFDLVGALARWLGLLLAPTPPSLAERGAAASAG